MRRNLLGKFAQNIRYFPPPRLAAHTAGGLLAEAKTRINRILKIWEGTPTPDPGEYPEL